jgi:hypothetical protein
MQRTQNIKKGKMIIQAVQGLIKIPTPKKLMNSIKRRPRNPKKSLSDSRLNFNVRKKLAAIEAKFMSADVRKSE